MSSKIVWTLTVLWFGFFTGWDFTFGIINAVRGNFWPSVIDWGFFVLMLIAAWYYLRPSIRVRVWRERLARPGRLDAPADARRHRRPGRPDRMGVRAALRQHTTKASESAPEATEEG